MEYRLTWTIDLDADSPEDAARKALAIHRDPQSLATVFADVYWRASSQVTAMVQFMAVHRRRPEFVP